MSIAADALQPQLVRELISLSGRASIQHFSDVITDAPKSGYDLEFDVASSTVRIDFREGAFITQAVGGDAARLASACFTSMGGIAAALEQSHTLAWGLIRLYYAAFYGGHSILRLLGHSCTYMDGRHTGRLKALAIAQWGAVPFNLSAGLYHCTLNSAQTGFSMVYAHGSVGGAHETFWEIFDAFLSGTTEDVLEGRLSQADARAVFAKIEAVRRIYRRSSGASWLSAVRNEVQYRQAMGVWAPPSVNRTSRATLARLAAQWTRDPMDIDVDALPKDDLSAFIAACTFTTALCRAMLSRVAERSSEGAKSFARLPLQLCS